MGVGYVEEIHVQIYWQVGILQLVIAGVPGKNKDFLGTAIIYSIST